MQVITRAWTGKSAELVVAEVGFSGRRASVSYAWEVCNPLGDCVPLTEQGDAVICQDAERMRDELERRG